MKVKIVIEIKQTWYGNEMEIISVEPDPSELSESFKDMLWNEYNIELE